MGGGIWVESEPGNGSRFIFTIKALRSKKGSDNINENLESASAQTDDATHTDGEFSGLRMLIVEDVEINREILLSLLEDTGFIIDYAVNGEEAVSIVKSAAHKYDIVLMDIQMPVMDGLEATRQIRTLPSCKLDELPIIAMTANVFKDDIKQCFEAGMNDHLSKPVDVEKLLKVLSGYLLNQ